jgi:hypothetical protein
MIAPPGLQGRAKICEISPRLQELRGFASFPKSSLAGRRRMAEHGFARTDTHLSDPRAQPSQQHEVPP